MELMGSTKSGKKNYWKCDSQELFERKLVDYIVHHYSRKRFFRKGFEPEVHGNLTRSTFFVFTHAMK